MLNKIDKEVMKVIYKKCGKKGTCLLKPVEILDKVERAGLVLSPKELEKSLDNLQIDRYIETILTDTKGTIIYCFTLKKNGEGFLRELENIKKTNFKLLMRTILLAILSFIIGMILRAIFIH